MHDRQETLARLEREAWYWVREGALAYARFKSTGDRLFYTKWAHCTERSNSAHAKLVRLQSERVSA